MNETEKKQSTDKKFRKKLLCLLVIISFGLSAVYSVVLYPLLRITLSDIVYADTSIPQTLDILQSVSDFLMMTVGFSLIYYAIFRFTLGGSKTFIAIYSLAVFSKYFLQLVASVFIDGTGVITNLFSAAEETADFFYLLSYLLIELLQVFAVVCIGAAILRYTQKIFEIKTASALKLGLPLPEKREICFPIRKLFDLSNSLQKSAFTYGILVFATKAIMRILTDIDIGAPSSKADFLWMIIGYLSDIVAGFISYFIMTYIFISLDRADLKQKELK